MNKDFRLISVNIHRICEGLSVLEHIAVHALGHRYSGQSLREIRLSVQAIERYIGVARLLRARVQHPEQEYVVASDTTVWGIVRTQVAVVTESLRALETFVAMYRPSICKDIEELRYSMYGIERDLLERTAHYWLHRYVEEGVVYPVCDSVEDVLFCIDRGAKMVQLRDAASTKRVVYEKAVSVCRYIRDERLGIGNIAPVLFFLANYPKLAERLPVAGVHLHAPTYRLKKVREIVGSNKIIGTSNTSIAMLDTAITQGSDYVGYGPIRFADDSDVVELTRIAKHVDVPLVAFGAIDTVTASRVYESGVDTVMVDGAVRSFFT